VRWRTESPLIKSYKRHHLSFHGCGEHSKRRSKPVLTHIGYDSMGYGECIPNGPHDCCGPTKAQGSKTKPASQVSAAQSKQSEGKRDTKGGQQLALSKAPSREPNILKFCI
jgi:hypothetical protein